ncbi:MAG TPA: RNA polymerase sigma factor [Bacillales bacterium]|nr:RNA polymerase sigma factor [Bacillales bacterium]
MRPLVQTPVHTNNKFAEAVLPYLKGLRSYCQSLTNSHWDGEDLAQKTLLKAYKSWAEKHHPVTKAYLYRIASNAWIDQFRKRTLDEDFQADFAEFPGHEEDSAMFEAMEVLLEKLTPKQRATVLLVDGLAYTIEEAAKWLDSTEGSVKAALHRARNNLKKVQHSNLTLEDEEVVPYVQAYCSGEAANIVQLYRREISGDMQMSRAASLSDSSVHFTLIQGVGHLYTLVTFRAKNGAIWSVPFYQKELSAILFQLEEERGMAA